MVWHLYELIEKKTLLHNKRTEGCRCQDFRHCCLKMTEQFQAPSASLVLYTLGSHWLILTFPLSWLPHWLLSVIFLYELASNWNALFCDLHFGWSVKIILKNLDPKRKILEATRTFRSCKIHCFEIVSSTERYYVIVWGKPALPIKIKRKRQFSIFLLLFCFFLNDFQVVLFCRPPHTCRTSSRF